MIQLGSTELNGNMVWVDKFTYTPVVQSVRTSLDGSQVVYATPLLAGRPITLVAVEDAGWLTKEVVDAVVLLAESPGATMQLTIGLEVFQVMFRHHDSPAIQFTPLIPRGVPLPGDYFIGTIKLMTI